MRRFKDIYQRAAIKKDSMQTIIENARQDFLRRHNTRRFLDKNKNEFLKKELNYGYEVIFTKNVTSTYFNDDDTLKNITYQNFSNALLHHELVRPEGKSAYDYFLLLKKDKDPNTDAAENKLFYALYDAIKDFLNAYLAGALIDAKKKDFEVAYEETSKLISFLDKNDFLLKSLQTKLYFFRAQIFAFSNDPNDWTTGVNLIDSALNMEKTAFSYLTKAILFSNKSQFFTAIKYLDTALIYAPNWKFALYNLATTNYKIQEFGKSIDYCKRVLKIDSNYSRMYSWLAYNYETIGDNSLRRANYEKAVYYNQKALEKDSTNSYAYLNLGRIYSKLPGNYYENLQTSKYYYRIGGLKYGDYHCLTMLGSCFINSLTHRADSAEYFYKLALKANPFDTSALIKYAYLFFLSGRRNSADSLFFSVLNYTKLDYKFLSKYRSYLFDFKSAAKADEIFAETIQRNSQDPSIFIQHSEDYESIDSLYKAKNILSLGMSYIDSSPSLNLAMASLFFNHIISSNFYKNALDSSKYYLDKVRFMSPTYSLVYSNLGTYFAIKRNNDSAIFYYKKADSLNGFVSSANNFDRYLSTLADFSLKKGNYSDAKKYYTMSDQVVAQTAFVGGNIADRKSLSAYNLARYYYINNRLKLAKKFCNRSINYFSRYYQSDDSESDSTIVVDSSFLNRQDELLALIEFEYKKRNNYKKSRKIFGDVFERSNDYLYYLEKAICNYKLGEKHKIEKAHMLRENSLEVYERITQQKRVNYSDYFIEQLNDFINYMDTSARSWQDIGKSAIPKSSLFSNNISFNSFVIKYGFTYSKLGTELPSKRFAPGRFYALAYELPLTKRFGIEPEVQLTPIPADSALKGNTFRNLSFPFLFTYRVNSFLYLNAGPQISFLLNRGSLKDSVENLRTIATFLNIGLTIKYRNLRIYSRYLSNIGRLNIADRPKNWNLRQLSFGIGLQLF